MSKGLRPAPEVGADLRAPETYVSLLRAHLEAVERSLVDAECAMKATAESYRMVMPHTKLFLYVNYVKVRSSSHRPAGLYWARGVRYRKHYHLPGGLQEKYLRFVAKDWAHRAAYRAFDARATCLNTAHKGLAKAAGAMRQMVAWLPAQGGRRMRVSIPVTRDAELATQAYASAIAFQVAAMTSVCAPELPELRLSFEQDSEHAFGRLRWRSDAGASLPPLTWRGLEQARIKRSVIRALLALEHQRRRLTREHGRLVDVVRRFVDRGACAVMAATGLIARGLRPVEVEPPMGAYLESRYRSSGSSS